MPHCLGTSAQGLLGFYHLCPCGGWIFPAKAGLQLVQGLLELAGALVLGAPQLHLAQRRAQPADAHADQAHGLALGPDLRQQVEGGAVDLLILVGRLGQGDLAGQGGEIGPAQLELDGRPGQMPAWRRRRPTSADSSRRVSARTLSSLTSRAKVVSWLTDLASCSVTTGLSSTPRAPAGQVAAVLAEQRARSAAGWRAMSPMVWMPSPASRAAVLGPTPQSMSAGSGSRKAASVPGGTTVTALGGWPFWAVFLPTSVAILATSLFAATPTEQGRPSSSLTRFCRRRARAGGVLVQVADIHEGLVDGDLLDQRREVAQALHDLVGHLAVIAAVVRDDQQARAQAQGPAHRHGRVDAEAAGGVGAGGHHAAFLRPAADGKGLAAQGRVVQFFDGTEEGVQVEVQDGAGHGNIIVK